MPFPGPVAQVAGHQRALCALGRGGEVYISGVWAPPSQEEEPPVLLFHEPQPLLLLPQHVNVQSNSVAKVKMLKDTNPKEYYVTSGRPGSHFVEVDVGSAAPGKFFASFSIRAFDHESYSPKDLRLLAGPSEGRLKEVKRMVLPREDKWVELLSAKDIPAGLEVRLVRFVIDSNHQGGQDSRVSAIRVEVCAPAPPQDVKLLQGAVLFEQPHALPLPAPALGAFFLQTPGLGSAAVLLLQGGSVARVTVADSKPCIATAALPLPCAPPSPSPAPLPYSRIFPTAHGKAAGGLLGFSTPPTLSHFSFTGYKCASSGFGVMLCSSPSGQFARVLALDASAQKPCVSELIEAPMAWRSGEGYVYDQSLDTLWHARSAVGGGSAAGQLPSQLPSLQRTLSSAQLAQSACSDMPAVYNALPMPPHSAPVSTIAQVLLGSIARLAALPGALAGDAAALLPVPPRPALAGQSFDAPPTAAGPALDVESPLSPIWGFEVPLVKVLRANPTRATAGWGISSVDRLKFQVSTAVWLVGVGSLGFTQQNYSGVASIYTGTRRESSDVVRTANIALKSSNKAEEFGPFKFEEGPLLLEPGMTYRWEQKHITQSGQGYNINSGATPTCDMPEGGAQFTFLDHEGGDNNGTGVERGLLPSLYAISPSALAEFAASVAPPAKAGASQAQLRAPSAVLPHPRVALAPFQVLPGSPAAAAVNRLLKWATEALEGAAPPAEAPLAVLQPLLSLVAALGRGSAGAGTVPAHTAVSAAELGAGEGLEEPGWQWTSSAADWKGARARALHAHARAPAAAPSLDAIKSVSMRVATIAAQGAKEADFKPSIMEAVLAVPPVGGAACSAGVGEGKKAWWFTPQVWRAAQCALAHGAAQPEASSGGAQLVAAAQGTLAAMYSAFSPLLRFSLLERVLLETLREDSHQGTAPLLLECFLGCCLSAPPCATGTPGAAGALLPIFGGPLRRQAVATREEVAERDLFPLLGFVDESEDEMAGAFASLSCYDMLDVLLVLAGCSSSSPQAPLQAASSSAASTAAAAAAASAAAAPTTHAALARTALQSSAAVLLARCHWEQVEALRAALFDLAGHGVDWDSALRGAAVSNEPNAQRVLHKAHALEAAAGTLVTTSQRYFSALQAACPSSSAAALKEHLLDLLARTALGCAEVLTLWSCAQHTVPLHPSVASAALQAAALPAGAAPPPATVLVSGNTLPQPASTLTLTPLLLATLRHFDGLALEARCTAAAAAAAAAAAEAGEGAGAVAQGLAAAALDDAQVVHGRFALETPHPYPAATRQQWEVDLSDTSQHCITSVVLAMDPPLALAQKEDRVSVYEDKECTRELSSLSAGLRDGSTPLLLPLLRKFTLVFESASDFTGAAGAGAGAKKWGMRLVVAWQGRALQCPLPCAAPAFTALQALSPAISALAHACSLGTLAEATARNCTTEEAAAALVPWQGMEALTPTASLALEALPSAAVPKKEAPPSASSVVEPWMCASATHPCALAYRVAQHRKCDLCGSGNGKLKDSRYMSCVGCGWDECMACVDARKPAGLLGQLAALTSGMSSALGGGSGAAPTSTVRLQQRVACGEAVVPHSPLLLSKLTQGGLFSGRRLGAAGAAGPAASSRASAQALLVELVKQARLGGMEDARHSRASGSPSAKRPVEEHPDGASEEDSGSRGSSSGRASPIASLLSVTRGEALLAWLVSQQEQEEVPPSALSSPKAKAAASARTSTSPAPPSLVFNLSGSGGAGGAGGEGGAGPLGSAGAPPPPVASAPTPFAFALPTFPPSHPELTWEWWGRDEWVPYTLEQAARLDKARAGAPWPVILEVDAGMPDGSKERTLFHVMPYNAFTGKLSHPKPKGEDAGQPFAYQQVTLKSGFVRAVRTRPFDAAKDAHLLSAEAVGKAAAVTAGGAGGAGTGAAPTAAAPSAPFVFGMAGSAPPPPINVLE